MTEARATMSDLGKRVAVAAVGVPTVLVLVYLGQWFIAVPLALFSVLGVLELYRLAAASGVRPFRSLGAIAVAGLVLLSAWTGSFTAFAPWALGVVAIVSGAGVASALSTHGPDGRPLASVSVTTFGVVYIGLSMSFVPLLHALPTPSRWVDGAGSPAWAGLALVMLPLAVTWIADTAAYFAGSAWGRSKLAPTISPKKSWVGLWAGLAGAVAAAVAWYVIAHPLLPLLPVGYAGMMAIGLLLGLGGVVGDLAVSLFKREAKVKDSGTLFPGHGGALDRLDAVIANVPLTYATLALAQVLS